MEMCLIIADIIITERDIRDRAISKGKHRK